MGNKLHGPATTSAISVRPAIYQFRPATLGIDDAALVALARPTRHGKVSVASVKKAETINPREREIERGRGRGKGVRDSRGN